MSPALQKVTKVTKIESKPENCRKLLKFVVNRRIHKNARFKNEQVF